MSRFREDLPVAVQEALAEADRLMASDVTGNIHSVGWGEMTKRGESLLTLGVVVTVKEKGNRATAAGSPKVPQFFKRHFTDVQEQPRAETMQLSSRDWMLRFGAQNAHQQCWNTPIPGGVEIYPTGKAWLGTLGCKVVFEGDDGVLRHGAITNYHVATGVIGQPLCQPGGNREEFAVVYSSPGVSFSGRNYVDLAVLNIERVDGKYAPSTHTVKGEQVTLGGYQEELCDCGVGARVARDGRTLGRVDDGRCVQIGVTVQVGYGNGVATFVNQFVCTKAGGQFSAPGDSGSMVFQYPEMKPFGLLFAGGGGSTIVSPAEYVMSLGSVTHFK